MKLNYKLALSAIALPAIFALGVTASPAQAQRPGPRPGPQVLEAADIAHQALRDKILHEAHDRFEVRFLSTEVTPIGPGGREVTGRGIFQRRGKSPQEFRYHITVKPREGVAFHAGYEIR
jgi:hypothetical protein